MLVLTGWEPERNLSNTDAENTAEKTVNRSDHLSCWASNAVCHLRSNEE